MRHTPSVDVFPFWPPPLDPLAAPRIAAEGGRCPIGARCPVNRGTADQAVPGWIALVLPATQDSVAQQAARR